jgi:hypothetical protein
MQYLMEYPTNLTYTELTYLHKKVSKKVKWSYNIDTIKYVPGFESNQGQEIFFSPEPSDGFLDTASLQAHWYPIASLA